MKLIIVESPTKAKTIAKFLGKDFYVESSFGHIRDLPQKEMGIDIENGFTPKYVVPLKSKKTVSTLKALVAKSDGVILASDEDREGEAIAWHLNEALKLKKGQAVRIAFHEITKPAILEALAHPRELDLKMVDAQQARRILDRLVGYELSPFLWKKVAKGLSAGRVQSVAIRFIVEREREIQKFISSEYWSLTLKVSDKNKKNEFEANLFKIKDKTFDKLSIDEKGAGEIETKVKDAKWFISGIEKKATKKSPAAPFTTATLQQSANRHLGFSAKQTMVVAQKLYEQGFITYMRTDSLNLSVKFLDDAREYLEKEYGKEYLPKEVRKYKNKSKNAQEAHEAVRPTEVSNTPDSLKDKFDSSELRLYRLIWQRALACQSTDAQIAATAIDLKSKDKEASDYTFRSTGQIVSFDGYLKIYPEKTEEQELPAVSEGDVLELLETIKSQHFTKGPARYSDAGLVKELEKYGIGRPSTYAPTINTIIVRNYVNRDDHKKLFPTDIAFVVNDLLVAHFPKIVDFTFTAGMEDNLDDIAEGKKEWQPVIGDFYHDFHQNLQDKYQEINKKDIMPEETSQEVCDKCTSPMIIKTGRYGKFLACSNFPECKNIKSLGTGNNRQSGNDGEEKKPDANMEVLEKKYAGEKCEKCGSDMAVKNGKFGPFLACSGYPKCKNIKSIVDDSATTCPACNKGKIVKKFSRKGIFYACSAYPDCKNAYWGKPTGEVCQVCGSLIIETKEGTKCSDKGCSNSK
ncbi:MAG: type I DNA topoisomerase [Patescibacteria group bacterium]